MVESGEILSREYFASFAAKLPITTPQWKDLLAHDAALRQHLFDAEGKRDRVIRLQKVSEEGRKEAESAAEYQTARAEAAEAEVKRLQECIDATKDLIGSVEYFADELDADALRAALEGPTTGDTPQKETP